MLEQNKLQTVICESAPPALGSYSHAVVFNGIVFVSGMASRDPKTDKVPGLELGPDGKKIKYDIRQETAGTLDNIERVLHSAGATLASVIEVNVYLLDMKDFAAYNEVYSRYFSEHKPARTTVAVAGLPGNISIEIKVVAAQVREATRG